MIVSDRTAFDESFKKNDEVYAHFDRYWGNSSEVRNIPSREQILLQKQLILDEQPLVESRCAQQGFDTGSITLVLLKGDGSANGHALLTPECNPIVWLAVECFHTPLEARIFLMHEIAHALHYRRNPELLFHTSQERHLVWRQLITEGIATYLTKKILNVPDEIALWADALTLNELHSWMDGCRNHDRELFEYIDYNFYNSDPSIALFFAAKPNDIFAFRAGYYAGFKLIEKVCAEEKIGDVDLLNIPADTLCNYVRRTLQNWNFVDNL